MRIWYLLYTWYKNSSCSNYLEQYHLCQLPHSVVRGMVEKETDRGIPRWCTSSASCLSHSLGTIPVRIFLESLNGETLQDHDE